MSMKENAIVFSVSQYRVKDEKTGDMNEGTSIRYLLTDNLAPVEDKAKSSKGYKPVKASLPIESYQKFKDVPGVYEVTLEVRPNSEGKALVVPTDFEFVNSLIPKK